MSEDPPLWGRMFARFQGEVPTTTLEAYRRASLPVFELLEQAESRRLAGATDGLTPWTLAPATRAASLCAWNAFVLQTLGNDILDADYEEYPATAGFVPPVTAEQVLDWFTQVEAWLDRAQQAHASPRYRLDVRVPVELPSWRDVHPCAPVHLRGMLRALHRVGGHAAAAMAALEGATPDGPEQRAQLDHIRQLFASAQSKARYAAELHGDDPTPDVRARVERHAREAIERFFLVGQLIADPTLASPPPAVAPPAVSTRLAPAPSRTRRTATGPWIHPLPGESGFDLWCLTESEAREALRAEPQAVAALERLWAADPDPSRTLSLQAEIEAARQGGDVAYAVDEGRERLGYWNCCPWGPIYVANRQLSLGGQVLLKNERFVLAAGLDKDGRDFRRRLLVGNFGREAKVTYGDR
jgi:hypothetical protein